MSPINLPECQKERNVSDGEKLRNKEGINSIWNNSQKLT